VVAEVEKANWNKILYDFLKFHMYFQHGAISRRFSCQRIGRTRTEKRISSRSDQSVINSACSSALARGFCSTESLLLAMKQYTVENVLLTSLVRSALIAARHRAVS